MAKNRTFLSLLGPLLVLGLWQIIASSGIINPILLPSPIEVFATFFNFNILKDLLYAAMVTFYFAIAGFAIGAILGVIIGIIIGWSPYLYTFLEFLIEFFRSLPAAALLPAFMLFFGIGNTSKVLLVAFSCSLVVVVNTAAGVKNRNPTRAMAAKILGANNFQMFSKVIFPEVLPSIATGLRISISLALIITVVAEMLVSTDPGLGRTIYEKQLLFKTTEMYAAILLTGLLGFIVNKLISIFSYRLIHWSGK